MAPSPSPQSSRIPARASAPLGDYGLLAVAVVAVSTSAPLVRVADAPTLAIAFWRNALSLPVLAVWLLARRHERAGWRARSARDRKLSHLSGVFLAAHFATWIPSLSFTTVVSSVALVATQPVWAALIARRRGEPIHRQTWLGIGLALAGTLLLTGVDLSISGRALFGDGLALLGGMLAAAYVTVGGEVRQRVLSTVSYALACYATASAVLLIVCLLSTQELRGYDEDTWLAIAGMVIGAQLLGHTLVNLVLRTISPTAVSVAILFEILGATLIARVALDETPPAAAWPAALLIGLGVVVVLRADQDADTELGGPRRTPHMTDARFVPALDLPDDWSGAITVVVRDGQVVVLDEHPDDIAPSAPRHVLGTLDGTACWAVDLDGDGIADVLVADALDGLLPLMGLYGRVDDLRWTLAGRAVQLVDWDRTTRFCGRCGIATEPMPGERARRCPSCGFLAFPRLAPAVITLVERDGEALLARGRAFPVPMYSCIAGFVEPGETMEEAVHREVGEEVGLSITDLRYIASQPWPFPHSLMIGFEATWAGGDIVIDESEIIDAQWFRADDLPMIPPGMSIARTLIDRWLDRAGDGEPNGAPPRQPDANASAQDRSSRQRSASIQRR